jgi:ATP-dependent DNA helicase DinG
MGAWGAETLAVPSPFDFRHQALLIVPGEADVPHPKAPDYHARCAALVARVCVEAGGRTLGLFTSRKALALAAETVRRASHIAGASVGLWPGGPGWRVLVQGDAPRRRLTEEFKTDVSSVLLGTKSFWAGVDVSGEACSCVVIDRIPFDPPDDPISSAMEEKHGRKVFRTWSLPRATVELRQGFGRLIRAVGDRGVVVICDRRLVETPWGKEVLRALPAVMVSRDMGEVGRWLGVGS